MAAKRGRRLSLTKRQRETEAGAELVSICQTITEDGQLTDDEINDLRQWAEDNKDIDLPARNYLWHTIEKILADGRITPDEREELYDAIEKVLPPDLRDVVKGKRKTTGAGADPASGTPEPASASRAKPKPIDRWDFMVAGVRYEGRGRVISKDATTGDKVWLVRDHDNPHSRYATEIHLRNGKQIGFVPEEDAREVAPLLDAGHPYKAHIKKILSGRRVPLPVVVASLYTREEGRFVGDAELPSHLPPAGARDRPGCASALLALSLLGAALGGCAILS